MSKISTYPSADTPLLLSDRLIGTEAIRTPPTSTPLATKNFSLSELLQLFSANFPAASLQAVLNTGNTATQNITLTGTIDVTLIKPDNIEDTSGSQGTVFQYLSKGTSSINWVDLPVDNLQAVLNAGNTATQNINLVGNITTTKIIPGNIQDDTAGIGTTGQILSKTASGIRWVNNSIVYTPGLGDVLSVGNTATNSITLIGDINASNARITGAIYDSNNSPGTAGQFLSSTVTGTDWVDGSASGYVPYVGANADVVLGFNNLFVGGRDEVLINETTISIVDDRLVPTRGVNIDPIGVVVTDYAGQNLYIAPNGIQFNDVSFQSTAFPPTGGTISQYIRGNGTLATFPTIPTITPSALTKTDDTNVTLTLGGTPATSLLQAVSLTLGWTGTLADSRITSASNWNSKQAGSTNLTSLSGLTYVSTSFVKMTAAGTFALDTNTYLTSVGTGVTNELTYWSGVNTLGSLTTATYPSLSELSYVKGITSSIQTQINAKQNTLVSGTDIKTINGISLLGSGDLSVKGVHALVKPSTGNSVSVNVSTNAISAQAQTTNRLIVSPFIPAQTITCSSLYINVITLLSPSNAQILIYSNLNGKPDTKIYQSADLDCSTIGQKTATTTQTFEAGTTYWIGVHTSATQSLTVLSTASLLTIFNSGITQITGLFSLPTYGSAPTTFGATSNSSGTMPLVGIRI